MKGETKKISIVGAGPAGLLLAHYLLRRPNYEITVIEKRPDPRTLPEKETRSFPIALQFRGQNAIRRVGLLEKAFIPKGVYLNAVCLHRGGKTRNMPRDSPNFSIDRNEITMTLLKELSQNERDPSTKINLRFGTTLEDVDLDKNQIKVTRDGKSESIPFDHLVAADGAKSKTRKSLVEMGKLSSEEKGILDEYRTIFLAQDSLGRDKLHTWVFDDGSKLIACPIHEGSLSGAYIFDKGTDPFVMCQSPRDVLDHFAGLTPSIRHLITEKEAEELWKRPTSTLVSVKCNQLHVEDKVVLLGDAAHAASASLGQGCNSSLQDVQIFGELLDEHSDDWDKALPAFTDKRLSDAHAVTEMSAYSNPRGKWMKLEWIFRQILFSLLPLWLSKVLLRPMPMALLVDEEANLSYSQILGKTQWWIDRVKKSQGE